MLTALSANNGQAIAVPLIMDEPRPSQLKDSYALHV